MFSSWLLGWITATHKNVLYYPYDSQVVICRFKKILSDDWIFVHWFFASFEIMFKFKFIVQHEDMLWSEFGGEGVIMNVGLFSPLPFIFIFLMHTRCRIWFMHIFQTVIWVSMKFVEHKNECKKSTSTKFQPNPVHNFIVSKRIKVRRTHPHNFSQTPILYGVSCDKSSRSCDKKKCNQEHHIQEITMCIFNTEWTSWIRR